MTDRPAISAASTLTASGLRTLFDTQRAASRAAPLAPLDVRRERLHKILAILDNHSAALAEAVNADFGIRSPKLTEVADVFVLRTMISHTLSHLRKWMKPQRVRTPMYLLPASAHLQRQPLGVVGIISPWNYPLQLSLGPAITALAAGNRVMLKPSELTPRTSALLAELISKSFRPEEFLVVLGDAGVAAEFSTLSFDHLFFTGSTAVGRKVAEAAARNLTPTTLELGGKSPCIVDVSARIDDAAMKIAHGKLLNAGQTCIAPDYVLLPRALEHQFTTAYATAVHKLFPKIAGNQDYASIISERHHGRLQRLLAQAGQMGARVETLNARGDASHRQMAPVLVYDVNPASALMQEEIFGPILPVLIYDRLQDAIDHINEHPRPLALYWFGENTQARDQVLMHTVSGGVTVNDTLMHIAHENLPFGGVGESGWGAYHGETGFLRFTVQKPVLVQSRLSAGNLFYPPYGEKFDKVMALLKRWL